MVEKLTKVDARKHELGEFLPVERTGHGNV